jgi:zinc protease
MQVAQADEQPNIAATEAPARVAGARVDGPTLAYEPAFLGTHAPDVTATAQATSSTLGSPAEALKPLPAGPAMAGEPLPVAQQVWYAPPWIANARGAANATNRPGDYRALKFPAAPFTPPKPDAVRVKTTSGVTAFIEEDALLPMVRVTAYVDATTVHDPAGKEGLAALTAEMLDRGGAGARSGDEIRKSLADAGVTITSDVTAQRTRLTAILPVAAQEQTYALLGEMLTQPRFDKAAFDRVKANAAIRADRLRDATATVLQDLFNSTIYGADHPFVRHATKASIDSLTLDDVQRFHASRYTAGQIIVAISGQVSRADVAAKLNAAFAKATAAAAKAAAPVVPEPKPAPGLSVKIVDRPSAQAQVIMGYPGVAGVPDDDAALEVMHYILAGGGFASRMMDELRTSRGLTAALYGEVKPTRFGRGAYAWRFSGNPDTIAEAIKVAFAEIEKMRAIGVTEAEFEKARTAYLEGNIPHAYDFAHARVTRFAQQALWGFYEYTSEQYLNYYAGDETQAAALRKLTLADVNAAAKKYLRPQDAVITIVGPLARIQRGAAADTKRYVTAQ